MSGDGDGEGAPAHVDPIGAWYERRRAALEAACERLRQDPGNQELQREVGRLEYFGD